MGKMLPEAVISSRLLTVFCSVAVSAVQVINDCMMTACLLVLESQSREKSFLPRGLMGAVMSGWRYVKHSTLCPSITSLCFFCLVAFHDIQRFIWVCVELSVRNRQKNVFHNLYPLCCRFD